MLRAVNSGVSPRVRSSKTAAVQKTYATDPLSQPAQRGLASWSTVPLDCRSGAYGVSGCVAICSAYLCVGQNVEF